MIEIMLGLALLATSENPLFLGKQLECPEGQNWTCEGCVQPPQLVSTSEPKYPKAARMARLEAKVILQAVVRESGRVENIKILTCTPTGHGFEGAAKKALKKWRYEPARQSGKPVAVYQTVRVHFRLG